MDGKVLTLEQVLELSDAGVWGDRAEENGIGVIRSLDIREDGSIDLSKLAIREIPESERAGKTPLEGDLLIERMESKGSLTLGQVGFVTGEPIEAVVGPSLYRLRCRQQVCDPRYVFWYLHWMYRSGRTELYRRERVDKRPTLMMDRYLQMDIPILSKSEQKALVKVFDQVGQLRQKCREADGVARGLLFDLFYGIFGDPLTNPKDWPVIDLGDVVKLPQRFFKVQNQETYEKMFYLTPDSIEKGTGRVLEWKTVAEQEDQLQKLYYTPEHILYCNHNPEWNRVAFPKREGLCRVDAVPMLPDRSKVLPEFLWVLLRTEEFVAYARKASVQGGGRIND